MLNPCEHLSTEVEVLRRVLGNVSQSFSIISQLLCKGLVEVLALVLEEGLIVFAFL